MARKLLIKTQNKQKEVLHLCGWSTHTPSSHTTHFHTTQSYLHKQIHSHTIRPQHTTCPQLPQTGSDIACYTKLDHTPVPLNDIDRQTSHLATKIVPGGRTFANVAFLPIRAAAIRKSTAAKGKHKP
jgi:hypothetical protein